MKLLVVAILSGVMTLAITAAVFYFSTTECYTINTHQDNEVFICEWSK